MACKILIVDDDPTSLFLHQSLIIKSGLCANPEQFLNGEEAFEYLEACEGTQDSFLILLDLAMPVMDGWEFLEKLEQADFPFRIDVAVVTSSIEKSDRIRAEKSPFVSAYLIKPIFNLDELRKIVKDSNIEVSS